MFGPVGSVRISLGAVVLDSPDHSGRYIARDMVGGWAYLIADREGDTRFRSQGGCPGGLEVQLRCAFLLAANQVPDSQHITVLVETRQAHRAMVKLARGDVHVVAAIAGRPLSVMTRPDERSSFQVRAAAERAAAAVLKERERTELLERAPLKELPSHQASSEFTDATVSTAPNQDMVPARTWRSNLGHKGTQPAIGSTSPTRKTDGRGAPQASYQSPARSLALTKWLRAFNEQVAAIVIDGKDPKR
jgi:hypothetical protein